MGQFVKWDSGHKWSEDLGERDRDNRIVGQRETVGTVRELGSGMLASGTVGRMFHIFLFYFFLRNMNLDNCIK